MAFRDWSLITGRGVGLGGYKTGGACEVLLLQKKGGGAEKVLAMRAERGGGGHNKFWGSFYAVP